MHEAGAAAGQAGRTMLSVWTGALVMMLAEAARPPLPPPELPDYLESDPYYSDEFDAFKACAARQALTYRYDYDKPDVSSAEQVAALLRRTCGKEIEALAKLVSPLEKLGGPQELTGVLDHLVVGPFFGWEEGKPLDQIVAAAPGTSVLGTGDRQTYFRAARGFGPDELVSVSRTDAFDAPNYIISFDQRFSYRGRRDGWTYSYSGSYGSWYGTIVKDGMVASIICSQAYRGVVSWGDHCDLKADRLISVGSRGRRLYPLRLCNPGHFDKGDVHLRPPPPPGSPRAIARAASLSIDDGAPIRLPDGKRCRTLDAPMLSQITHAKRLHSSFIGRDDTRTVAADGSGEVVAMGLALMERLHALTFDARAASEMTADQQTLYRRALPFTVRDALLAHDEWRASVACVVGIAALGGRSDDSAIADAMSDAVCADPLADLDWRAASFRSGTALAGDGAARSEGGPAKIAEARVLLRNEAAALLARGWRPTPRAHFANGETPARVMGHAGFAGRTETVRESAGGSEEPYGYAIDGHRAWGVIPSLFFGGFDSRLPPQSIVIGCDGDRQPACTIRIPTDDRKGAFELHTDGSWHGARICLSYGGQRLAGWRIFRSLYSKDDEAALLDENGCVTERRDVIARAVIEQSVGPVLVAPDGVSSDRDELISFQEVTFALALTRFLAERVAAGR